MTTEETAREVMKKLIEAYTKVYDSSVHKEYRETQERLIEKVNSLPAVQKLRDYFWGDGGDNASELYCHYIGLEIDEVDLSLRDSLGGSVYDTIPLAYVDAILEGIDNGRKWFEVVRDLNREREERKRIMDANVSTEEIFGN
jgi:hypothetical protein